MTMTTMKYKISSMSNLLVGFVTALVCWNLLRPYLFFSFRHSGSIFTTKNVKSTNKNNNTGSLVDATLNHNHSNLVGFERNYSGQTPAKRHFVMDPLRVCTKPWFPIRRTKGPGDTISESNYGVQYLCNGTEYDKFGQRLQAFMENSTIHSKTWGRRKTPIPQNTSVLFLGNSHTKQTVLELVCQYAQVVEEGGKERAPTRLVVEVSRLTIVNAALFYFPMTNSSIYLLFNSQIEIAENWQLELERVIERRIDTLDAIILGQFNNNNNNHLPVNTTYYKEMMELSRNNPNFQFGKVLPPNILTVSEVYPGPIIFLSAFSKYLLNDAKKTIKVIEYQNINSKRNHPIRVILGRKYIETVFKGHECGAQLQDQIGKCDPNLPNSHRCVGSHGGYPTLTAHDVQEALFSMLEEESLSSSASSNA